MTSLILDIFINSIFASVASTGFAMLFNVPKDALKFCAIGGAITYIIKDTSMDLGLSIELATFIADLVHESESGGIACEPGCVFFPCQGHQPLF